MEHVHTTSDPEAEQDGVTSPQGPAKFSYEAAPAQQEPVIMSNGNATHSGNDSMESPDVSLEADSHAEPQQQVVITVHSTAAVAILLIKIKSQKLQLQL